jgi:hypothetical protein
MRYLQHGPNPAFTSSATNPDPCSSVSILISEEVVRRRRVRNRSMPGNPIFRGLAKHRRARCTSLWATRPPRTHPLSLSIPRCGVDLSDAPRPALVVAMRTVWTGAPPGHAHPEARPHAVKKEGFKAPPSLLTLMSRCPWYAVARTRSHHRRPYLNAPPLLLTPPHQRNVLLPHVQCVVPQASRGSVVAARPPSTAPECARQHTGLTISLSATAALMVAMRTIHTGAPPGPARPETHPRAVPRPGRTRLILRSTKTKKP